MTKIQALPLRDYQRQALDALDFTADIRRLAVVLPTGAGKTVCFAHQILEHLTARPDGRVVVLVHTDELVSQAHGKILDVAPHLSVGIVKAERNEVTAQAIVASVQSLRSASRRAQLAGVTMVIVDECHHATARTYMDILTALGCFGGDCVAVGYTATLVRGDGKSLYPVWQDVAFSRDISWMVRKRYLVPPRGIAVEVPDLDLKAVKASRSDYQDGALGEALAESLAPELVAKAIVEHAPDRRGILFAPTVASAEVFAEALSAAGISAAVVHGGMPLGERRNVLERHRSGEIAWVCNCMVLTEGYDDPRVSAIAIARPTKSRGLYIQMAGRGLRVDPTADYEGQDCLLLDVSGAGAANDLRTVIDLSDRTLKPEDAHGGKTLIELEDDLDAAGGVLDDEAQLYRGPTQTREFDPMGRPSTKVWIKTRGGTFFVPAGKDHYVFIMEYPARGRWSVCSVPKSAGRPAMTGHRGLPLDQALVWAEDLAYELGAATLNTTQKSAPWRKRVASDKMVGLARGLGLTVEGVTEAGLFVATEKAGPLSDRITEVMGSRRIDPLVKIVNGRVR
jgi:superfamily II DNA or RNA helicase